MTHNVVHLKSIERPNLTLETALEPTTEATETVENAEELEPWPVSFDEALSAIMRQETIEQLKELLLSGSQPTAPDNPVQVPDSNPAGAEGGSRSLPASFSSTKDKKKPSGKERGGKGRNKQKVVDNRRVLSDVSHGRSLTIHLLRTPCSQFHQRKRDPSSIKSFVRSSRVNSRHLQRSLKRERKEAHVLPSSGPVRVERVWY